MCLEHTCALVNTVLQNRTLPWESTHLESTSSYILDAVTRGPKVPACLLSLTLKQPDGGGPPECCEHMFLLLVDE